MALRFVVLTMAVTTMGGASALSTRVASTANVSGLINVTHANATHAAAVLLLGCQQVTHFPNRFRRWMAATHSCLRQ